MLEFLQKSKIIVVSLTSLIVFGILLNILAYVLSVGQNFYTGLIAIVIFAQVCMSYLWLYKLHRVLLVIRYKKVKNGENKKDDGQRTN